MKSFFNTFILYILNFGYVVKYFLNRKPLPVTWGNTRWYEFEDLILPGGSLPVSDPQWYDYEAGLPVPESAKYLDSSTYPHHELRLKLNNQIIDLHIINHEGQGLERPVCILTCGGTASGKTSAVNEFLKVIPQITFLRIDYDRLKKFLPEYPFLIRHKLKNAAHFTQSESVKIGGKLFKEGLKERFCMIYEKTLHDHLRAFEDIQKLRKKNYQIIVIATHATEAIGQERALIRFEEQGRFVPPDLISKIYATVHQSLFEIRHLVDEIWLFDNNGSSLSLMLIKNESGVDVINPSLYQTYLSTVGAKFDLKTP